jgi:hypothetical protein
VASRRVAVFFYGLFMAADLVRSKGTDPANIRSALLEGFALRIGKRATLIAQPGAQTYGVIMDLTHADIERLYADASVAAYRPEAVVVHADGATVPALCFNLVVPPQPTERNADYAEKLRDLATRLGFPSAYIETIN